MGPWLPVLLIGCIVAACADGKTSPDSDSAEDPPSDGVDSGHESDTDDTPRDSGEGVVERRCNGLPQLCDRRLDEVTFAGTHNSMSNADAGWLIPNQQHGLSRQLADGVRSLMLDTHDYWGEPYLCHFSCELGKQPLHEGLQEIRDFLDENPDEVIVLIIQDGISAGVTEEVFAEVGLADASWVPPSGPEPLPTLRALLDAGTPLVVTAEVARPPPAWYLHAWDLVVDTPYSFSDISDFQCDLNRGAAVNPLFLVNHWLSTPLASEDGAIEANALEVLQSRVDACDAMHSRRVNIVAVDFYNHGGLFELVERMNE